MTYFQRGLDNLDNHVSSTSLVPERQKRFTMKKGEAGTLMVVTPNISECILAFEHSWFRPGVPDKAAFNMFATCEIMQSKDLHPRNCPICAEQMFNSCIQRRAKAFLWVIDFRVFTVEGKQWSHTPKLWVLSRNYGILLRDLIKSYSQGSGNCEGMVIDVRRQGDNAPNHGNHFQIKSQVPNMWGWLQRSPRVRFYQEKIYKKENRRLTSEEAVREYFGHPDLEKLIAPSASKREYFLAYVRRTMGMQANRQSQPQRGWGSPMNPQYYGYGGEGFDYGRVDGPPIEEGFNVYGEAPPGGQSLPANVSQPVQPEYNTPANVSQPVQPEYNTPPSPVHPAPVHSAVDQWNQEMQWDGQGAFDTTVQDFGVVSDVPAEPPIQPTQPREKPSQEKEVTETSSAAEIAGDVVAGEANQAGGQEEQVITPESFDEFAEE